MYSCFILDLCSPKDGQFGNKYLKDSLKYCNIKIKQEPIDFFLGRNVFSRRIMWKESYASNDDETISMELGSIPINSGKSIDDLSIDFESWTHLIGRGEKGKTIGNVFAGSIVGFPSHDSICIPYDIDTDLFKKEIENWCKLNTIENMEELFNHISNVRYGSDAFTSLRKVFKEVINKPIKSASAFEDAKKDLWDELVLKHKNSVPLSSVIQLTFDELQSWFQKKHSEFRFIHEGQIAECSLPLRASPMSSKEDIVLGKVSADSKPWNFIDVHINDQVRIVLKHYSDAKEFDVMVPVSDYRGHTAKPELAASALEKCKESFTHYTKENAMGSMLSVSLDSMEELVDAVRLYVNSNQEVHFGIVRNAPLKEYADSIERFADIKFGFNNLLKIHYQFSKSSPSPITINEIKKFEGLISNILPSISSKERYAEISKMPMGVLREEKLENLAIKLQELYWYIEPFLEEYIQHQLGYPKNDRGFFVKDQRLRGSTYQTLESIYQEKISCLLNEDAAYHRDSDRYSYVMSTVSHFDQFTSMLTSSDIQNYRTKAFEISEKTLIEVKNKVAIGIKDHEIKINDKTIEASHSKIYWNTLIETKDAVNNTNDNYGELRNLKDLLSIETILQTLIYTKFTLSIEDATFLNLNHKTAFVRAEDAIVDFLDSSLYKGMQLTSSIYA
jgi:hypothetical protein